MKKNKTTEVPLWAATGHSKPTTRREFLAHGIIPFAASAIVPGALGLFSSSSAHAGQECPTGGGSMSTLVTLNLAGGAALAANWLPRDAGGAPLASYNRMGGGTSASITTVSQFGRDQFSSTSQILAGIVRTATPATLANTAFVGVCVQSRDDSDENKFDVSGMAFKAGVVGSLLPNMGSTSSASGVRQVPSTVRPPPPLVVRSVDDISNSIGFTAGLRASLTDTQKVSLAKLVQNLSDYQTRKLASVNSAAHVKTLVDCAGIKNVELLSQGSSLVDPIANAPTVAAAWGFTAGTSVRDRNRVFGSMVYNGLAGKAGTVNLEMGGYDYHNGTRTLGDTRDGEAGEAIGRILESAKLMNKPVFLYVTSDGSVSSADSDTPGSPWVSDRGSAGSSMIFMYSPNGRPATTAAQIGQYTQGQVADDKSAVGNNPEVAAQAVIANYLQFNKKLNLFAGVAPSSPLTGATLQGVVKVG